LVLGLFGSGSSQWCGGYLLSFSITYVIGYIGY